SKGDTERAEFFYSAAEAAAAEGEERPLPLIAVLRARAAAYARAEKPDQARADLKNAINLIEDYRARITDERNRSEFLDAFHDIFDQLVELEGSNSDGWVAAFNASEEGRARTLIDEFSSLANKGPSIPAPAQSKTGTSLNMAEIQRELPGDLI